MSEAIIISAIVMVGVLLTVIAWQIFAIGKSAVSKSSETENEIIRMMSEMKKELSGFRNELSKMKNDDQKQSG